LLLTLVRLLIQRFAIALPMIFAVVTLTFFLIRLAPGDPALILAGDAPTPEFLAQVRSEYGLDQPILVQYVSYLWKAMQGDFGQSIFYGRPVFDLIWERFPATALLTVVAIIVASTLGILLGVLAARHAGTGVDTGITIASLVGYSIPNFWTAQILVLVFAVELNLLPAGGMTSARITYTGLNYVLDVARHIVLPVVTLALFLMTFTARFTRAAMVDALDQDFVMVAQAKGATGRRVLWNHAFPNAIVTVATVIGLEFGALLAGAVVTEIIFGWPGLGRLFYDAIYRRDFPLLTGAFIFTSAIVVIVNVLTDVLCAMLDPRLRR